MPAVQILCLAEQIQFTEDVERALRQQGLQQLELELAAKLEHYTSVDTSSEEATNTGLWGRGSTVNADAKLFLGVRVCAGW